MREEPFDSKKLRNFIISVLNQQNKSKEKLENAYNELKKWIIRNPDKGVRPEELLQILDEEYHSITHSASETIQTEKEDQYDDHRKEDQYDDHSKEESNPNSIKIKYVKTRSSEYDYHRNTKTGNIRGNIQEIGELFFRINR